MTVKDKKTNSKVKKKVTKKVTKKKIVKKKAPAKKSITKRTPGNNSKWHDHYLEIIKNLFEAGRTINDICVTFNISKQTYFNWKKEFFTDEFIDSIADWKENADRKVEQALFRKATGFIVVKEKSVKVGRKYEKVKEVVNVEGDVQAQRYWLNNRKKKDWSEKNEATKEPPKRKMSFGFKFDEEAEDLNE